MVTQWRYELTPYSQRAHLNYLMVGSFWGHSVRSQGTHKISSHCEVAVSFPWVCNWHCKLTKCPQNELAVSFNMSWQWISCDLKFVTELINYRLCKTTLSICNNSRGKYFNASPLYCRNILLKIKLNFNCITGDIHQFCELIFASVSCLVFIQLGGCE